MDGNGKRRRSKSTETPRSKSLITAKKSNESDRSDDNREKYLSEKLISNGSQSKLPKVTVKTAQKTLNNLLKGLGIEDQEVAERLEKKRHEQEKAFRYYLSESIESLASARSSLMEERQERENSKEVKTPRKNSSSVMKNSSSVIKRNSGDILRSGNQKRSRSAPKRKVSFSSVTYMNIDGKEDVEEIPQVIEFEVKPKSQRSQRHSTTFVKTPPRESMSKRSIGSSSNSTMNSVSISEGKEQGNLKKKNDEIRTNKKTLRIFTEVKRSSSTQKTNKSGVWKDKAGKEEKEYVAHTKKLTKKDFNLLNEAVPSGKENPPPKRPLKEIRNVQKTLINWVQGNSKEDKEKPKVPLKPKPSEELKKEVKEEKPEEKDEKPRSSPVKSEPAKPKKEPKPKPEKPKGQKSSRKSEVMRPSSRDHQTQFESLTHQEGCQYQRSDSYNTHKGDIGESETVEGKVEEMRESVFIASEAIYILANTIFKDSPYEKDLIAKNKNQNFQELLNAQNDLEALNKVSNLFQKAEENIEDYLRFLIDQNIYFPKRTNFSGRSVYAFPSFESFSDIQEDLNVPSEFNLRNTISRTSQSWQFPMTENPYKAELSLKVWRGKITETINAKNTEFEAVFDGNKEKIKNLIAAGRVKAEVTSLRPKILCQMVERACSLVVTKLVTMKYFTLMIIKEIALVTESSVLKPILPDTFKGEKVPKKVLKKLRAINVFGGVLFQISTSATTAFAKIRKAIEKAKMIEPQAPFQRIPGIDKNHKGIEENLLPIEARIPVQEGMRDLNNFMEEAEHLYLNAKHSLKALHLGVKLKSCQMKMLRTAYQVTKNLFKPDKDLDFGAILMIVNCNISVIMSFNEILPQDSLSRHHMRLSLNKLNKGVEQLENMYSSLKLIALFLTKSSMANLATIRRCQNEKSEAFERTRKWLKPFIGYLRK